MSTSKACGTVDSLIKIEFKSKFSPEITVEKDESVAEILFLKVKEVDIFVQYSMLIISKVLQSIFLCAILPVFY